MKRMNLIISGIVMAGIIFAAGSTVFAQNRGMSADERVAELKKVLTLTSDQEKKIKEIYESEAERRGGGGPGGGGGGGDRPRGGGMMFGMGGRSDRAVEEVLSEDQVTKFRAYRRETNIQMRVDMLDRMVKLTDDQKKKVKAIYDDEATKTEKMFGDSQNSSDDDRRAMFEKMRTVREESETAIMKVLTKEQGETYNKAMEEMRQNMQQRRRNE